MTVESATVFTEVERRSGLRGLDDATAGASLSTCREVLCALAANKYLAEAIGSEDRFDGDYRRLLEAAYGERDTSPRGRQETYEAGQGEAYHLPLSGTVRKAVSGVDIERTALAIRADNSV